jgi:hypothetical protein
MTDDQKPAEERIEDLDVPESESEDVKGGLSLNYSKIEFESVKAPKQGQVVEDLNVKYT